MTICQSLYVHLTCTSCHKIYIKLCPESEKVANKKLDEAFLKLIHEIKITDIDFQDLVVEDPFFNRMTNVTG